MLNLINSIPVELGWALVGFTVCLCCIVACKLGKLFVEMWKGRHEDEEN